MDLGAPTFKTPNPDPVDKGVLGSLESDVWGGLEFKVLGSASKLPAGEGALQDPRRVALLWWLNQLRAYSAYKLQPKDIILLYYIKLNWKL